MLTTSSFPESDNHELIELLVTGGRGTNQEDFFKKFESILKKTPTMGRITSDPQFFIYGVIGTFTVLPHTQLMEKLNIKHIYINPVKSQGNIKTVKVALQLENNGKKEIQLYTFSSVQTIATPQHWSKKELSEILAYAEITKETMQSYMVDENLKISGKIYNVCNNLEKNLEKNDAMMVTSTRIPINLLFGINTLIKESPLPKPNTNEVKFKEIVQLADLKVNLESYFSALSTYANDLSLVTDANQREIILKYVATEVEGAVSNIFTTLSSIYNHWKDILRLGDKEISYHGYSVGILENLFKYRYALDISVEKNLGKGRADLIFMSRLDGKFNKNWDAIPVNVEFKAGKNIPPNQGLEQIGLKGYLHHTPRMRTLSTKGVAIGVNFAFTTNPVSSQIKEIKTKPINFIKQLLDKYNLQVTEEQKSQIGEALLTDLNDIDYSIVRQNGGYDNSHYLRNFLLGQAMGSTELGWSIYAATSNILHHDEDLVLFFVKGNEILILHICHNDGSFVEDIRHFVSSVDTSIYLTILKNQIQMLQAKGMIKIKPNSKYFMLRISQRYTKDNAPNIREIGVGSVEALLMQEDYWRLKENDKFYARKINSFEFIDKDNLFEYKKASKELYEFKSEDMLQVIASESDLQALCQGGILASGKYQVFTESNHLHGGLRADLIISPIRQGLNARLKIFELKYVANYNNAMKSQQIARDQLSAYLRNLKSFTDEREVDLVALIYNSRLGQQQEDLFLYHDSMRQIDHTSGAEGQYSPVYEGASQNLPYGFKPHQKESKHGDVKVTDSEENLPSFHMDRQKGLPYQSPDHDYHADVDSPKKEVGSSKEKKTDTGRVGTMLAAISTGLVTLGLAVATTVATIEGGGVISGTLGAGMKTIRRAISDMRQAIRVIRKVKTTADELQDLHDEVQSLLDSTDNTLNMEIERKMQQRIMVQQQLKEFKKIQKEIKKQENKATEIADKYTDSSNRVEQKIDNKRQQATSTQSKNKRTKKELCEAGPSRAKRDIVTCILRKQSPSMPFSMKVNARFGSNIETVMTLKNKLFSLCHIKWDENERAQLAGDKILIEPFALACDENIDYQDKEAVLVDLSLWNLRNSALRYTRKGDEFTLFLPLLNGYEKRLVLADINKVDYELIDSKANIFKPVLKEEQPFEPSEQETGALRIVDINGKPRKIGSQYNDNIFVDNDLIFVAGWAGKDVYTIKPSGLENVTLYINNRDENCVKDYLVLPVPFNSIRFRLFYDNSIILYSTHPGFARKIYLNKYCDGPAQQHLDIVPLERFLFEPPDCKLMLRWPQNAWYQTVRNFRVGGLIAEEISIGVEEIRIVKRKRRMKRSIDEAAGSDIKTEVKNRIKPSKSSFFNPIERPVPSSRMMKVIANEQKLKIDEGAKGASEQRSSLFSSYDLSNLIKGVCCLFGRSTFVKRMNQAERLTLPDERNYGSLEERVHQAERLLKRALVFYDLCENKDICCKSVKSTNREFYGTGDNLPSM